MTLLPVLDPQPLARRLDAAAAGLRAGELRAGLVTGGRSPAAAPRSGSAGRPCGGQTLREHQGPPPAGGCSRAARAVAEDALLISTAGLTARDPAAPARSGLARLSATSARGPGIGRSAVVCAPPAHPVPGTPALGASAGGPSHDQL